MNFLAHLYVADETSDSKMGSLLGDFVKGMPDHRFSAETRDAIWLHRAVDQFTDGHPIVLESKTLISPCRRRFAGIIVDICYDHFLCRNWTRFSANPLSQFVAVTYRSLQSYDGFLPERAATVIQTLIAEDWLSSYQSISGISSVLNRVSNRVRRANTLYGSGEELMQNYELFNQQFLIFFEDLIQFAKAYSSGQHH